MKFAKFVCCFRRPDGDQLTDNRRELERELVPEWRAKYLDYKVRETHANFVFI
jgi:hypothetical protein